MEVVLAHPEGYEVMPEVEEIAKNKLKLAAVPSRRTNDMKDASKMQTSYILRAGLHSVQWKNVQNCMVKMIHEGIKALEKFFLKKNGKHKDWACNGRDDESH